MLDRDLEKTKETWTGLWRECATQGCKSMMRNCLRWVKPVNLWWIQIITGNLKPPIRHTSCRLCKCLKYLAVIKNKGSDKTMGKVHWISRILKHSNIK